MIYDVDIRTRGAGPANDPRGTDVTTDPATEIFYALRNNKTGEYIRGQSQGGRLVKAPALYEARMRAHHARSMRPEVEDPADWEAVPVRVVSAEHYDDLLSLARTSGRAR